MTTIVADEKERFLDQAGPAPTRFRQLRETARELFLALPWPGPRTEDWRSTNLAPLLRTAFEPADAGKITAADLPPLPTADTIRLVFVNGTFQPALSALPQLRAGLQIGSLGAAGEGRLERSLGHLADARGSVFTALNTASLRDGAYVLIADNVVVERPIDIVYLTQGNGRRLVTQPRTLIVAGKNSRATVVERFLSPGREDVYFTNAVTEISVAEHAAVDHYKVQDESLQAFHIAATHVAVAGRSTFSTHALLLGGGLVRNEVRVRFDGQYAEATVNGLYRANGKQHIDNFTEIDHAQPHCASHELYKGVLDGHAHGVFNGKIQVRSDAQKTDAKQTNKVLLLSDNATINTKPQLEIFADDVKCTHGATVGQLDPEMLFYLRARGIDLEGARTLLTFAFANDIVNRIKIDSLREELESRLIEVGEPPL